MALASSMRPTSTSNKDSSLLDDDIFNQFVDAETFDFSDSSFETRTPSEYLDSWFDEPEIVGSADPSVSPPSSSSFVESYHKTFILEEECATFSIDPILDVPADSDAAPRTPARTAEEEEVIRLPSTVETVRRSQSCSAKKGGERRRRSVESPTMSHPRSRRVQKGAWAQQLERSVQPQGIQSPQSTRYGPISPPLTITQSRYQAYSQTGSNSQHRPLSYSSQVSPLSQQFPTQAMPYFGSTTTPVFPELSSYAQSASAYYQPLDPCLALPTGLTAPSFSNPFPSDADIAWDHEVAIAGGDPTFSFPSTSAATATGYNDTKVQPWAPPGYSGPPVPMTAPLSSAQQHYYTSSVPLAIQTNTIVPPYHLPQAPQTANPHSTRSISPMYPHSIYPTSAPLLAIPKTRRDRTKSRSATPLSSSSRSPSPLSPLSTSASTSKSRVRTTRSSTTGTSSRRSRSRSQARHSTTSRHKRTTSSSISKSSDHAHTHGSSSSSHHRRHRSKSHAHNHNSTSPAILTSPKRPTRHRKHKDGSAHDPFVNLTALDSKKILTGVAPSGSSKTKAKREKEAAEKAASQRRELSEVAVRAVREAGGDLEVFEREGRGLLMER